MIPRRSNRPLHASARLALALAIACMLGCEAYEPLPNATYRRPDPAHTHAAPRGIELPAIASVSREPVVRVRIARQQTRVRIASHAGLTVGPADPARRNDRRALPSAVTVTYQQGAFLITDANRHTLRWTLPALLLAPSRPGATILLDGKVYPGAMVLTPTGRTQGGAAGRLDVVEHVAMESYLPGVVERELYGSWAPTTFRAAAIAARSYAVFESSLNRDKHYDLESSTASQAYAGRAVNPKATAAVAQTRGMLLAYRGRVVPAFYSSTCGGAGQDATAAFTWLAGLPDIEPLRGRDHGARCRDSPKFRWPTVTRHKAALAERLRAWGAAEGHPIRSLRGIRDIRITRVNAAGRPTTFAVTDDAGLTYTLGPEQFRFAANTGTPRLGAVPKDQTLYSSHVQVAVGPKTVSFHNGRGYGHGVGLCQFGAQALARSGYNEYSVLAFYYPGSRVVRAYR